MPEQCPWRRDAAHLFRQSASPPGQSHSRRDCGRPSGSARWRPTDAAQSRPSRHAACSQRATRQLDGAVHDRHLEDAVAARREERRGIDDRRSAAAVPCPQRRQECGVARRPRSTLLPPRGPTSTPTRPFAAAAQLPWEAAIAEQVAETVSMSTAMMGTSLNRARMTCLRGFSRCSGRPLDSGG
jgi:hypothetical protein